MLYLVPPDCDPVVQPMLVYREARFRERRIGEGAQRHRRYAGPSFDHIGHGRSALRAESIECAVAAVGNSLTGSGLAGDGDAFVRPARLGGKGASRALLAFEAMTNGAANRLAFAPGLHLSSTAGGETDKGAQ